MNKETWIFVGIAGGAFASALACYEYNTIKVRKLEERKVENERLYFSKLTSDQVEAIEKKKLEVENNKIELKKTEAELKRTINDFKDDIHDDILEEVTKSIHDDMRETFDNWSSKYEDRLDKKVDRVVSRIDDLSDKYGGVKSTGTSAPTISVVNAPNN